MNNTVKFNLEQSLTDEEKEQARTNIGAAANGENAPSVVSYDVDEVDFDAGTTKWTSKAVYTLDVPAGGLIDVSLMGIAQQDNTSSSWYGVTFSMGSQSQDVMFNRIFNQVDENYFSVRFIYKNSTDSTAHVTISAMLDTSIGSTDFLKLRYMKIRGILF